MSERPGSTGPTAAAITSAPGASPGGGGAATLWVDTRFRGQAVKARATATGQLLVGPGGFVEFRYQPQGKSYKSRPESFELVAGAVASALPGGQVSERGGAERARPSTKAETARATSVGRSRVVGKSGGSPIVELSRRRGAGHAVQVWTDGACSGNPGPAGLGVHAEYRGEAFEIAEYLGSATNNIAELMAIVQGLEMVAERYGPDAPIDVMTDSEYCLGLLGLGWKAKANQELVERLRKVHGRFGDLLLVKVKGHAGVPGNERADALAREAIAARRSRRGPAEPLEA